MGSDVDLKKLELQKEYLDKYEDMVSTLQSENATVDEKLDARARFQEVRERYQEQVASESYGEEQGWQKVKRR